MHKILNPKLNVKSFFQKILEKHNLTYHDGRPLWQFNLSLDEYKELKEHLSQVKLYDLDAKDIAFYIAEWWKNDYNGGTPSYETLYNLISSCSISLEEFKKTAKKSISVLNLKLLRRERREFFRTLLSQGGLPLNHMDKNIGAYTRFLKKVIDLNPSSIEEFAYEDDIIKLLPMSSRNESVYNSCLEIAMAFYDNNEKYLSIFDNKANFKQLKEDLREQLKQPREKRRKPFKSFWILKNKSDKAEIVLGFNFPKIITKEEFIHATNIQSDLRSEYHLFVNDNFTCRFRKNTKGDYLIILNENTFIKWQGEETKPDIHLLDAEGNRFEFPPLNIDSPKSLEPFLLTQLNEQDWLFVKGKNCSNEIAAVLYSGDWEIDFVEEDISKIKINGNELNFYKFAGSAVLKNKTFSYTYRTSKKAFDWVFNENRPDAVLKSNIPITRGFPAIHVYDSEGKRLPANISWRVYGSGQAFRTILESIPTGLIDYKIIADDCEENGYFFNIGDMQITVQTDSLERGLINFDKTGFLYDIKPSERYSSACQNGNIFEITANSFEKFPNSIAAQIKLPSQNRAVHIEIVTPFKGIRITDAMDNILPDNTLFVFGRILGYRIYTPLKSKYKIKIFNSVRPEISMTKKIGQSITPLREYEELALKMFKLSDPLQKGATVILELYNDADEHFGTYYFKNHNNYFTAVPLDEDICIGTEINDEALEAIAVPIDCHPVDIETIELEKSNGIFCFPEDTLSNLKKFIIFAAKNSGKTSPLPRFFQRETGSADKIWDKFERVYNKKEDLEIQKGSDRFWQELIKYYDICTINNIPYSTFDVFRAASLSQELAAKMFCQLCFYNEHYNFIEKIIPDMEDDLGVSFHWISPDSWGNAINWIELSFSEDKSPKIQKFIGDLYESTPNMEWFAKIKHFIQTSNIAPIDFIFKQEVQTLQSSLGEKVINALPQNNITLPKDYKNLLPHIDNFNRIKTMLYSPLIVALSLKDLYKDLWYYSNEEMRRDIRYAHWLAPIWYSKAIIYFLNELKKQKL